MDKPYTILVKFPTRNRPEKFLDALRKYIGMADDSANMKFMITLDRDDTSYDLHEITSEFPSLIISMGESKNKVDAINRDMNRAPPFDIVLLASDDMLPVVQGYDRIIRTKMKELYPDTDGVLWFHDGYQKRTNTLIVMGKKYFDRFGFLYDPVYKSFFCDNEFTNVAEQLKKQTFIDETIIKHEHPANTGVESDELYKSNDKYWKDDEYTYNVKNKTDFEFDITVLICTMPSRIKQFTMLHKKIVELAADVDLKIEILSNDRMDIDVGTKRDNMLQAAKGKYSCFIDDDDDISNTYFKEYETLLKDGKDYDCFSLVGKYYSNGLYINPFYHFTKYTSWYETTRGFFRYINHLNLIKTYISRSVGFKSMTHGEDKDFSVRLYQSGRIKTEGTPKDVMYHYYYVDKNTVTWKPRANMGLSFLRRL